MAAEIELKKINEYVQECLAITSITGSYVYGIDSNGNSIKIAVEVLASAGTDYSQQIAELNTKCNNNTTLISQLQTALSGKANANHTHTIANVTNLQTALDGKSNTGHTHEIGDVAGLQTALNGKAAAQHTHTIANVVNLQSALDGKSNTGHTHAIGDVANLQPTLANHEQRITDLEGQGGGSVGNGLKQVDLSTYSGGTNGEIVQHVGETTADYTNGYTYKCAAGEAEKTIPSGSQCIRLTQSGEEYISDGEADTTTTRMVMVLQPTAEGVTYNVFAAQTIAEIDIEKLVGCYVPDEIGAIHQITAITHNGTSLTSVTLDNGVTLEITSSTPSKSTLAWYEFYSKSGAVYYGGSGSTGYMIASKTLVSSPSGAQSYTIATEPIGTAFGGTIQNFTASEDIVIRSVEWAQSPTQPETSVASGDYFLSQTDGAIGSTISIAYNSSNQHLELKGINDAVVAFVDMAVFIKDGMLENVEKYTTPEQGVTVAVPYLKFTFNTDSGKSVIRISFADLIDTFDGSNVDLTSAFVKSAQYSAPAIGDSMDVAIGKLLKGHEVNAAAIATKQDTLTFDSKPTANSTNPVTSQGIKAAIDTAVGNVPNALKQVDLTTYQGTTNGEIVQHRGNDTADFKDGYVYQFVGGASVTVPTGTKYVEIPEGYPSAGLYYIEPSEERNPTKLWKFTANGSKSVYAPPFNKISVGSIICPMWLRVHTDVKTVDTVNNTFTFEVDGTTYTASNGSEYSAFNYSDYMHGIDNGNEITYGLGYEWVYKENGVYGVCFAQNDMYPQYSPYANVTTASEPTVIGAGGWQRINVQPSSEGAVSDLETRMTAAETAISGKQDLLTFDDAPTADSGNVVKSGGVKTAIDSAPRFYIGTCSTAGNVAIKQVDIPNFPTQLVNGIETPIVGSVIAVKFSNDDEITSKQKKIKVNNTDAYPVWFNSAEQKATLANITLYGCANKYIYYAFNGTHWVWVSHSNDNDTTYTPVYLGFGYASCTTAAATAAKTASLNYYKAIGGGLVVVYFQYDVPAQATLNINSQGAKQIHFQGSRIAANVIKAGDKCLFIYNGNYMLIAIDRWGKELQEKVSGINISETDFEALSTYEQGKLYFVFDNNS